MDSKVNFDKLIFDIFKTIIIEQNKLLLREISTRFSLDYDELLKTPAIILFPFVSLLLENKYLIKLSVLEPNIPIYVVAFSEADWVNCLKKTDCKISSAGFW